MTTGIWGGGQFALRDRPGWHEAVAEPEHDGSFDRVFNGHFYA